MISPQMPCIETKSSEPPTPRRRWGLSEWSIALLFAEPLLMGWGEPKWQNWIFGPSAPTWLPLAENGMLKQVSLTVIAGVFMLAVLLVLVCFRYRKMRRFLRV